MAEVSVIVPVYRVEEYLDRCVGSILRQTFEDFELILVDDGSPDRCPRMCDEWAKRDGRVRVIHKENGGVSSARNAGLDAAEGKYITFVDSDDWIEPDAISYLLWMIRRYNADFSMAALTRHGTASKANAKSCSEEVLTSKEFIQRLLKIGSNDNVMYSHCKLYKASIFRDIRYKEGIALSEDLLVTFQYAMESASVAASNRVVYHYFVNKQSATLSAFSERTFDMIRVADLVCQYSAEMRGDMEIQSWAEINRKRAGFGVLANLVISDGYAENYKKYKAKIDCLRRNLKRDLPILLAARIPLSRKAVMWIMCHAWDWAVPMMNYLAVLCRRIMHGKKKKDARREHKIAHRGKTQ